MLTTPGAFAMTVVACSYPRPADVMSDGGDDSAIADARPDATLVDYHYVIDRINVPTNNTQANNFGLDLDGDGTVDNQLGMVISTFSTMGIDTQGGMSRAVDRGEILQLLSLSTFDFTTAYEAHASVLTGASPNPMPCSDGADLTCRRHFAGTGVFEFLSSDVMRMPGEFAGGVFAGGPGRLTLGVVMHPGGTPVPVRLIGAHTRLTSVTATSIGASNISGAVSEADVQTGVLPAMRDSFMIAVQRDCNQLTSPPSCGCAPDTDGKTFLGLFDTGTKDCNISVAELQTNSLIEQLLEPDLMIEGQSALSIGVQMTAVRADFAYP